MNAFDRARSAYDPMKSVVRTQSSIELEAFTRVTRKLRDAQQGGTSYVDMVKALHDNRMLWTLIATDVADPANRLPTDLRARLFYLSEFTTAHSRKVANGTATVDALIDINTSVMQGLRRQTGAT